jgi:hypothetical protein
MRLRYIEVSFGKGSESVHIDLPERVTADDGSVY